MILTGQESESLFGAGRSDDEALSGVAGVTGSSVDAAGDSGMISDGGPSVAAGDVISEDVTTGDELARGKSLVVTLGWIAEFFGVTERMVNNWAKQEKNPMPREARGVYDFVKVAKWAIDERDRKIEEQRIRGSETLTELEKERLRIANMKAQVLLDKELGKLVNADDVRLAWLNEMKILRQRMSGVAFRINTVVGGDSETLEKIKREIDDLREEIARLPVPTNLEDVEFDDVSIDAGGAVEEPFEIMPGDDPEEGYSGEEFNDNE